MKIHSPLYSDIIFLVDHYNAGFQISIAYCLFSLEFIDFATCLCIMQCFFKAVNIVMFFVVLLKTQIVGTR